MDGVPYRVTVDIKHHTNIVDLNSPPDALLNMIFKTAYESENVPYTAPKMAADAWSNFDIEYMNRFGTKPSETIRRGFQQKVLASMQKSEIDGALFRGSNGEDTFISYMPHKLAIQGDNVVIETPSITKQLEARKWLDEYTFTQYPNEVTRSYSLQSRLQFESKVLQDMSETLTEETFKQGEMIDSLVRLEDELESIAYKEKEDLLRIEAEEPKFDIQKTIREGKNPCL